MTGLAFLLFLFLSPPEVFKGAILDPTGAAIAAAQVEISGQGLLRTVQSDGAGQFEAGELPSGKYMVRVSATGFAAHSVAVEIPSPQVSFTLYPAAHSENVIVTTTRFETPINMVGVSATVLDSEEVARQQSPPLYEMLRDVPGMAVANTSRRGGTTSIYTRGGGKNANLLLVDGVQVNDPGGDFNFAHLTTTNVDRVEIVRGPQSAVYGSNAAAAVVQVVTHQGTVEDGPAAGFASVEGGTFGTYRYRAGISGILKDFDYSSAAEHLRTEGAYTNDAYTNWSLSENLGYRLQDHSQVRFTLRSIRSRVGVPNRVAYGLLDPDAFRTGANIIGGGRYERTGKNFSQRIQLGFTRFTDYFQDNAAEGPFDIGAIVSGTAGARGSEAVRLVQFLSVDDIASANFVVPPGTRLVRRTVRLNASPPSRQISERRAAEYQANWNYSESGSLVFGYDLEQERGIGDVAPPLRNNHGLFVSHQHRLGSKLFLTESARLEDNSVFQRKTTPRFAVSYLLSPTTRWKASAGTGISEPSFLQNFANDPTFVGNRSLRPERSRSVEAGVEQHVFGSAVVVEATLFHNCFRDLIVFTPRASPLVSTWENVDASNARGLELSASVRRAWLRVRGQYTFLDTRVIAASSASSAATGVGQELPRRPRHSAALDVTAAFHRAFLNLNTTLIGERQDSDGVGFGIVRNPGYQKVDFGASYKLRPSLEVFVRVENLLNNRYQEVLGYTALSRNALAGLNLRWRRR